MAPVLTQSHECSSVCVGSTGLVRLQTFLYVHNFHENFYPILLVLYFISPLYVAPRISNLALARIRKTRPGRYGYQPNEVKIVTSTPLPPANGVVILIMASHEVNT
jgi:hypothetical protein